MNFKKFTSIENSYRQKEVQSIQINFPKETFLVQEKVHGANFSFWTDGEVVRCAKRTGFIKEDESFFNYERVLDRYETKIIEMFKGLKEEKYLTDDLQELVIFGEIYGGNYPHPDVETISTSAVQKHVYYCNDVDFIAFDIKANGSYVDFNKFKAACMVGQIPFLDAIAEGTLEECLAVGNEYHPTVPALHGLPNIEGNICEGNVIRPHKVLYFGNGSRVILKNKNDRFMEIKKVKKKAPKAPVKVPEHVQEIQMEALAYVTENRLRNVISKIGTVGNKDFGKLLGLLIKDSIEDFVKDQPKFLDLNNEERKMVTRLLNNEAGNMIRPNFVNIIDGNF